MPHAKRVGETTGIYQIVCDANDTAYVGKTSHSFEKRRQEHFRDLRERRHVNNHLQRAFDKHGVDTFRFEIVVRVKDMTILTSEEVRVIRDLREQGRALFNQTDGGDGMPGRAVSSETRAKIANALKGRKLSSETKAKISAASTGRKHTEATLAKLTGVTKSAETRAKIGAAKIGNAYGKGSTRTAESRAKIGATHAGKPKSQKHREKLAVAIRAHYAQRAANEMATQRSNEQ